MLKRIIMRLSVRILQNSEILKYGGRPHPRKWVEARSLLQGA